MIARGRLGLYAPWALFLLACFGWGVYWRGLAQDTTQRLAAAVAPAPAAMRASGFPLGLRVDVRRAEAVARSAAFGDITAALEGVRVSRNLSNPGQWRLEAQSVRLEVGRCVLSGGPVALGWRTARRDLARASLSWRGGGVERLQADVRPDPRDRTRLQLALTATGWTEGDVSLAATGPMAPLTPAAIDAWAAPGAIVVEAARVQGEGAALTGDAAVRTLGLAIEACRAAFRRSMP